MTQSQVSERQELIARGLIAPKGEIAREYTRPDPVVDLTDTKEIQARESVPMEISGVLKWFNPTKGYGFIVPPNGQPDVLLHITVVKSSGFTSVGEGSKILVTAIRTPQGLRATSIVSIHALETGNALSHIDMPSPESCASDWERVHVVWFNERCGLGCLIKERGSPKIYVHMETIKRCGLTTMLEGQNFDVRWSIFRNDQVALEIRQPSA